MLAYLGTRPYGATLAHLADAFGITLGRARTDIKSVRDWLGVNPRTGEKHLPDARQSTAAKARGVGVYQVDGLLIDADLFRRLRVRGEARGADGITDLSRALTLVGGQPFDQLRTGGWSWLHEGDRLDQHALRRRRRRPHGHHIRTQERRPRTGTGRRGTGSTVRPT